MKKELPTFSFHTAADAYPEDQKKHWNMWLSVHSGVKVSLY